MTTFLGTALKKLEIILPSWQDWKVQWEEATDRNACVGLLHSGFQTEVKSAEEHSERLRFFLRLADLRWPENRRFHLQSTFSHKAFQALANHFHQNKDALERELLPLTPETVEDVFQFFRQESDKEGSGLRSIITPRKDLEVKDHSHKRMNEVLLRWAWWVWHEEYLYPHEKSSRGTYRLWPHRKETIAAFKRNRVCVIDILHAYDNGQLEKLLLKPILDLNESDPENSDLVWHIRWDRFTHECLDRLEELALKQLPAGEELTVERALVAGSSAAKVFTLVKAAQQQLASKAQAA